VLVISVAVVFAVLTFVVKVYRLIAGDSDILFMCNHIALFLIFFSGYAWLAKACFYANRRFSKGAGIEPWIRKRYLLLGISAAFISLLITPTFFMGSMSSFFTMSGFYCVFLMVVELVVFSILNYLCWVMPPWFKNRLGASYVQARGDTSGAGKQEEIPAVEGKLLTNRETMAIIDYLGNMLAARINKSPSAIKGLLLVTFQGEQDERGAKPLSFSDVRRAVAQRLSSRLEQLGIKDADAITRQFSEDVTKNQSMLLMMSV
jgi:hypothetical protein